MKPFTRVLSAFAVGILLQGGVYLYLDQYMFAPTTEFNVAGASKDDTKNFPDVKDGTKYVSYDRQFMAVVTENSLKIYKANESKPTTIDLKGRSISYFNWMPDRNYAIMGLYDSRDVVMARLNADDPEHEVDTKLEDLPKGSKIVDAAYSEATNVVYMKVKFKSMYIVFIVQMLTTIRVAYICKLLISVISASSTMKTTSSTIMLKLAISLCLTVSKVAGVLSTHQGVSD